MMTKEQLDEIRARAEAVKELDPFSRRMAHQIKERYLEDIPALLDENVELLIKCERLEAENAELRAKLENLIIVNEQLRIMRDRSRNIKRDLVLRQAKYEELAVIANGYKAGAEEAEIKLKRCEKQCNALKEEIEAFTLEMERLLKAHEHWIAKYKELTSRATTITK